MYKCRKDSEYALASGLCSLAMLLELWEIHSKKGRGMKCQMVKNMGFVVLETIGKNYG